MKIINGPKWLNVANMMRSVKVAPLTVSDNMIADNYLLALLMTACKPGDFLIFMDATIEQQLFADLNIGPKYNGLKSQFLCTDLQSGIDRMITPHEVAAAEKMQAEEKAKEEQAEMASYKEKYEELNQRYGILLKESKDSNELIHDYETRIENLNSELTEKSSTINELRTALQSAADKIESMRDEFNAACKEFGLSKDTDGKWSQDLMKVIEYTELKKQAEELKDALTTANDLVASQKDELDTQDKQLVRLHTIIGKASAKFNIYLGSDDEWYEMNADKTTTSKVTTEDTNEVAEEFTEKINEAVA